ncbi:MAG: methyltransferase domain-containing protein [Caldilineales bacterium]|nr:methyltransferase domain-containing protein [Caldilineales bacterium]
MSNPWSNPDDLSPQAAAELAAFIDARSQRPDQSAAHDALIDALAPQPGERVIDLGCGAGVIARRVAARVQPQGEVLGVDISRAMLDFAESQPAMPGLRYQQADSQALPCADASFDAATAARLLMHVDDPQGILREARRIVRPLGRIAILEADWGTAALDHSDRALTRRIIDWRTDHIDGENWMGRQLVRHCLATGWGRVDVRVWAAIARDDSGTLAASLRRCADLAFAHSVITIDEKTGWLAEIDDRLAQGSFLATMNEYIVVARNPAT